MNDKVSELFWDCMEIAAKCFCSMVVFAAGMVGCALAVGIIGAVGGALYFGATTLMQAVQPLL